MGQPDFKWTPPADAVPVEKGGWKPPADAIPLVPKKASAAGSAPTSQPSTNGSTPSQNTHPLDLSGLQNIPDTRDPEVVARDRMHQQVQSMFPTLKNHLVKGDISPSSLVGAFNSKLGDITDALSGTLKSIRPEHGSSPFDAIIPAIDASTNFLKEGEKEHPMSQTYAGELASGVAKTVPTLLGAYATGGGSLEPEAAGLAGNYLSNQQILQQGLQKSLSPITKFMTAEGALTGAGQASKESGGKLIPTLLGGIKGGEEGFEGGVLLHGSMESSEGLMNLAKKIGVINDAGKVTHAALKALVTTPAAFATADIANDLSHGKPLDVKKSIAQGYTALPFEIPGVVEALKANEVTNFMTAKPEDIERVAKSPETADELQLHALGKGIEAQKSDDPNALHLQQLGLQQDADIKSNINAILKNKDGYVKSIQESELPAEQKQQMIDKVNEVHKQLDPIEQNKSTLANQIQELQNTPTKGIIEEKEKTVKIKDLNKQLDEIIANQYDQKQDRESGKRITYSKGIGEEEGKFFKTVDGKKEPITESRYKFEKPDKHEKSNNETVGEQPTGQEAGQGQTEGLGGEQSRQENGQSGNEEIKQEKIDNEKISSEQESGNEQAAKGENVAEQPGIPTKEQQSPGESGSENEKGLLNSGGEQPPLNQEENAIQEQIPREMGVRQQGTVGEGVGGQNESEKSAEKSDQEEGQVKKTILTKRAYEGEIQPEVKKFLEEKGLTRKVFSQEERSKQATDFINKFGEEAAQKAVEAGDIEGGAAASVLAQLQIKNSRAMADFPEGSEERDALAKKQADIIALMEKKGYLGGEFNGQLAHEYQNAELDFANVKRQVEQTTGKPVTPGQEKKIKEITSENEKLKTQLQEAEAKLIEETDKAFESGKEAGKNETNTEKAKRIANKLRDNAKLNKPGIFSAATPASLVWDGAIEVTAKAIEAGGKLADAVEAGIKHIKETDWYKNLPANKKELAEKEFKRVNYEHSGSTDLSDLQERFVDKTDNKFTPNEAKDIWGYMKENYIEKGTSYRDAISKTADDLGLSWRQVSEAVITPKIKRASDEMWKKVSEYTRNRTAIKSWVADQNKSSVGKALQKLSGIFRGVAVFGHGGIFVGTHAGMTVFNPSMWNKTIPAFFRGWKFAYGNEGAYQREIEALKNSPNYLLAERAGLKNNPDRINTEEYQKSQQYLGKLALAGEKGFNAIKVLRQDLFDYHFNKLSPAERDDPEVAKSLAHLVNLATGATNLNIPAWVNEASFAGGMEASRWEKLTASPIKATNTALNAIFNPDKASTADRVFAKVWARRVGEQLATYSSLLLANAAIQNSINPKNPVNYTDPNKPDFMKFKFGTTTIDPTSGMRSTAMFMRKLGEIPFQSKKELHGDKRLAAAGKDVANYARGKLAPLYATGTDFFTGTDFTGNPLPYNNEKPGKGHHKLTWLEYAWSKAPLPVAEAANVAYKSAEEHGANKMTLDKVLSGIMSGGISGTTGFRVGEYDASAPENKKKK